MKELENHGRLITCILPKGEALNLLKKLSAKGITRANFAFARGFDIQDTDNLRTGFPDAVEKEIVTVLAKDKAEGEAFFDYIFTAGNINRPGGGLMHMSPLRTASPYQLPQFEESV